MTPEKLKVELEKLGWRISRSIYKDTGVDWYAWLPSYGRIGMGDCTSNERPPSFCINPWHIKSEKYESCSVEFDVCGAVDGDRWLSLKAYSVPMDKTLESIPAVKTILSAAWNAALAASRGSNDPTQ